MVYECKYGRRVDGRCPKKPTLAKIAKTKKLATKYPLPSTNFIAAAQGSKYGLPSGASMRDVMKSVADLEELSHLEFENNRGHSYKPVIEGGLFKGWTLFGT